MSINKTEIQLRILDWASPHFPLHIREEAAKAYVAYIKGDSTAELDCFASQLKFGTGGLRGILGWGAGRMNRWTVGRVTLGLCNLLRAKDPSPSLAIAFDSRRMSSQFAQITAGIAAKMGLKVYLFDQVTPTPILSYAVRSYGATAGVVITASHNPPEYNGYKVYGPDGSQLVGDMQNELEKSIEAIGDWGAIPFLEADDPLYQKEVKIVGPELKNSYFEKLSAANFVSPADNRVKAELQVVYSPLHGTGGDWLPQLLQRNGFPVIVVSEQEKPDGEFPTVELPNPEERSAMQMAAKLAKEKKAAIFIATDPDADRLGAGVRTSSGEYLYLNGNQIGSLMCAFLCERLAQKNPTFSRHTGHHADHPADHPIEKRRYHVFKTIVTTNLQREIGRAHGVEVHNLLTGFKYIAEQMRLMEQAAAEPNTNQQEEEKRRRYRPGDLFLFGGEESYGYLPVDFVRDKDALASALLLCEMLAQVGNLSLYLDQIFMRYGLYSESLRSVSFKGADGLAKMNAVMDRLRKEDLQSWRLGSRQVKALLDYRQQLKNGSPAAEFFGNLPAADVLQLLLEPEGVVTVRPSGTEPKVKLYTSLRYPQNPSNSAELDQARLKLEQELSLVSNSFFERSGLASGD